MSRIIAIGKVSKDGDIIRATPGITVTLGGADSMYKVNLPDGMVYDDKYIVQLTPENFGEDGPDFVYTTIGLHYQSKNGFLVSTWSSHYQTSESGSPDLTQIPTNWHFVIYDLS